jgi:hypothetical protein
VRESRQVFLDIVRQLDEAARAKQQTDAECWRRELRPRAMRLITASKKAQWVEHIAPSAPIEISVHAPVVKHTLTLRQVESWIDGSSKRRRDDEKNEAEGTAYRSLSFS